MKIVFTTFYSEDDNGGAGRVAHELAAAFAKIHEVLLIFPGLTNSSTRDFDENLLKLRIKGIGSGDIFIPTLGFDEVKFIFQQLNQFSPDIVHAHDPNPISLVAQIWAMINKVPFFCTAHELPSQRGEFGLNELSKSLGKILKTKPLQNYFLTFFKNCTALIALNHSAETDLRSYGYNGTIFIIPNGRNLALYNSCPPADVSDPIKRLIFVGWISERKNQKYLIEVMRFLPPNFQLTLVGTALNPQYLVKLKRSVNQAGMNNIRFTGTVTHKEIPNLLQQTHVFVSASKMEIQSLAVLEALASSTPVVGLSNETIDELVDETTGANLPKNTPPEEYARVVNQICTLLPEKYKILCRNARQRVANLDWQKTVEKTEKAYQEIIKNRAGYEDKTAKLQETLEIISNQKTKSFITQYAQQAIRSLKPEKAVNQPKIIREKTQKSYLYLMIIIIFTLVGGFFYRLIRFASRLTKKN